VLLLAESAEAGSKIKQEGMASWYKMGTHTANGERYDPMGITAAHPSLPFDTKVRVTNPRNGDSVVVRINDRGPFTGGRIIDLSQGAAQAIKIMRAGVAKVKIEVVGTSASTEAAAVPEAEPAAAAAESVAEAQPVTDSPPLRLMAERQLGSSSR
jgi:rare lipoprotein A